jgi:hypothetical protein
LGNIFCLRLSFLGTAGCRGEYARSRNQVFEMYVRAARKL